MKVVESGNDARDGALRARKLDTLREERCLVEMFETKDRGVRKWRKRRLRGFHGLSLWVIWRR